MPENPEIFPNTTKNNLIGLHKAKRKSPSRGKGKNSKNSIGEA